MATIIPLFLEGAEYDVYAQMEATVQGDVARLKVGLRVAFGLSPALAFAKFKARILAVSESPDALVTNLRRLAQTAAADGDKRTIDQFVL